MKTFALALVAVAVLVAHPSKAEAEDTAQTLLTECEQAVSSHSNDYVGSGHCYGYLGGVADTLIYWRTLNTRLNRGLEPLACIPAEATNYELAKVVIKYLNNNPTKLHEYYSGAVMDAFAEAYPCITK